MPVLGKLFKKENKQIIYVDIYIKKTGVFENIKTFLKIEKEPEELKKVVLNSDINIREVLDDLSEPYISKFLDGHGTLRTLDGKCIITRYYKTNYKRPDKYFDLSLKEIFNRYGNHDTGFLEMRYEFNYMKPRFLE